MSAMQYRQHVFTELLTNLQVTGWSAVKAPLVSCAGVQERGEGGGGQDERGAGRRGAGLLAQPIRGQYHRQLSTNRRPVLAHVCPRSRCRDHSLTCHAYTSISSVVLQTNLREDFTITESTYYLRLSHLRHYQDS